MMYALSFPSSSSVGEGKSQGVWQIESADQVEESFSKLLSANHSCKISLMRFR
jgi:hypothetical protein